MSIQRNDQPKAARARKSAKARPSRGATRSTKPRTNRESREDSVDRIYHSALRLFVQQGYRSTSIDEIAAGAGLTKGGVYFYISKKEHLMAQMLDDIAARYIDAPIAKIQTEGMNAQERLVSFMHFQVSFALECPEEVMLLVMSSVEFSKSDDMLTKAIDAIYGRMRRFIVQTIEEGLAKKVFKTRLHPHAAASFYVATHDGIMLEWYRRAAQTDGPELVRVFREAFLRVLS